ncbi:MAG: helix-turn-helix domain-containing protein [Clostridiales Family XIII bacterium]|jgi:hypothetical protein|nr:helix-turn-helix domain-containing protein [Clostridiales Family XIII bacterium]
MTQTVSSPSATHRRLPLPVVKSAADGDIEAMTQIQQHFEPYLRRLATIEAQGVYYLNTDLYDRLKTRLIVETMNFKG